MQVQGRGVFPPAGKNQIPSKGEIEGVQIGVLSALAVTLQPLVQGRLGRLAQIQGAALHSGGKVRHMLFQQGGKAPALRLVQQVQSRPLGVLFPVGGGGRHIDTDLRGVVNFQLAVRIFQLPVGDNPHGAGKLQRGGVAGDQQGRGV